MQAKAQAVRWKQREDAIYGATGYAVIMALVATYQILSKHWISGKKTVDWNAVMQAISDRPALLLSPLFYAALAIGIGNGSRICAGIMMLVMGGAGLYDGPAGPQILGAIVSGWAFVAMGDK